MSQSYGTKTIGATASVIVYANNSRRNLTIVNTDASVVLYIGPDDSVTTANGIPIYGRQSLTMDKISEGFAGAIYGIAASNIDVRYWENRNVG